MNLPELPRNPRPGDMLDVAIDSLADGGQGRGRWQAHVGPDRRVQTFDVRARGALPGEQVTLRVLGRKRRVLQGQVTAILTSAPDRITPRCDHAWRPGTAGLGCGGCSLQGLSYAAQLAAKRDWVADQFANAGFAEAIVPPALSCEPPWEHRNKMEYSFGDADGRLGLGLHPPARRYEVVDLQRCHLHSIPASRLVVEIANWARGLGLAVHSDIRGEGWLRTVAIREGKRTGERLVELTTSDHDLVTSHQGEVKAEAVAAAFAQLITDLRPEVGVDSLYWSRRRAQRGEPTRLETTLLQGQPTLSEELALPDGRTLRFAIHPRAFFQPNTRQAEVLYGQVMAAVAADNRGRGGRVLDLYCGTGTIGLCLAPLADEVVGIELQPDAVQDANRNASDNGIHNARFLCGDVGAVLARDDLASPGSAAVAVVDPPRSGLSPAALALVAGIEVPRLVYVSCNPMALARDAALLCRQGYRLSALQPVDMFPHAWHVETVARFDR